MWGRVSDTKRVVDLGAIPLHPFRRRRTLKPPATQSQSRKKGEGIRYWGRWLAFAIGTFYCVMLWASPFLALVIGTLLALTLCNPAPKTTRHLSDVVLQISVVLLGFALVPVEFSPSVVGGVIFAAFSLIATLFFGFIIGRLMGIPWRETVLISTGTAVCGGSAISTIGPTLEADEKTMNVAVGTIFLLNMAALYSFPLFGHALELDPHAFGVTVRPCTGVGSACVRRMGRRCGPRHLVSRRRGRDLWHGGDSNRDRG